MCSVVLGCGSRVSAPVAPSAIASATPVVPELRPRFRDRTATSGIDFTNVNGGRPDKPTIMESVGAGVCLIDADGDGRLDVYLVNGSTVARELAGEAGEPDRLFRNLGAGRFEDATAALGLGDRGWGQGCAVGDWDNDGRPDLFVTNWRRSALYRNEGGRFREVTAAAGVAGAGWPTSSVFADIDGDGNLDLYVGHYSELDLADPPVDGGPRPDGGKRRCRRGMVATFCGPRGLVAERDRFFRNQGDGTFRDETDAAGIEQEPLFALGVVATDLDLDGWVDLYVANDSVRNCVYRNRGGRLEDVGGLSGAAYNNLGQPQGSMGVDAADYNGDGLIDIFTTNFSEDYHALYQASPDWSFSDVSFAAGVAEISIPFSGWGARFFDFDLDGRDDILAVNGHVYPQVDLEKGSVTYLERPLLYHNLGEGKFREEAPARGLGVPRAGRGLAVGDLDGDGALDLVVGNLDERAQVFVAEGYDNPSWLLVSLESTSGNRDAVGAVVKISARGKDQLKVRTSGGSFLSAGDPRVHFGLAGASKVDRLEVRWPRAGGHEVPASVFTDVPARSWVRIREGGPLAVVAGGR